jgi:hypothetical protein
MVPLLVCGAATAWADTYSNQILSDHPAGYWRLNEPNGATTAVDSSGYGQNGTYNGGVALGNAGARFDGFSGYVDIPGGAFNYTHNFSVEAWVTNENTSFPTGARKFISNRSYSGGWGVGILAGGNLDFTAFTLMDFVFTATLPADGKYHHVVIVFDSSNNATLYLDGVFQQTIAGPPVINSGSDVNIGGNPINAYGDFQYWQGKIGETAIYSYALAPEQVQQHYATGVTPTIASVSAQVTSLVSVIGSGEVNSLLSSLAAANSSIAKGNTNAAKGQLGAFINKVQALNNSHRLDAATSNSLIGSAQYLIAHL